MNMIVGQRPGAETKPKKPILRAAEAKNLFQKSLAVAGIGCAWVWLATANIGNCQLKAHSCLQTLKMPIFMKIK